MSLAAFRSFAYSSLPRKQILRVRRRVSITRICERLARASNPSTNPTGTRNACSRDDVVSGTTKHASGPNPLRMTDGRTYHSPFPSCSVPTFTPSAHHQISRTVYNRGCSACVRFLTSFHWSKSFFMALLSLCRQALHQRAKLQSLSAQYLWVEQLVWWVLSCLWTEQTAGLLSKYQQTLHR